MPTCFDIVSLHSIYGVEVQAAAAAKLLESNPTAHVIIDAALVQQVKLLPTHSCLSIVANEDSKEFEAIATYLAVLREARLTRSGLIVAIGGGVIQDISGFIASIYMRGVTWHYAPTTLLGMLDSCIGGKSSINAAGVKNLVGTYCPPKSIIVDPGFIKTLKHEQIVDGLCEAAKICFAHPDTATFDKYMALDCLEPLTPEAYDELITLTLKAKKWFIEKDEFDKNERLLLNFGHTFGHAIETAGDYVISHGIGVGLGMLCAMEFAQNSAGHPRVKQLYEHVRALLASVPELAQHVKKLDASRVLTAFQKDKKHSPTHYTVVVPDAQGQLVKEKIARDAQCDKLLAQAINQVITSHGQI
ncbi:MAG TPA: 3-dehydroquinate synthase family protein [Rickettsiales bacterium]|nr:3-dehydroquinate synthase family protein [Rickettsiales bacterium]